MLKEVVIALEKIHEWSIKYPGELAVVLKKYWITMKDTKVQLHIKIRSKEKLTKDVDRVLASYRHLFNGLKPMIQIHGVPSIEEVRQVRKQEDMSREVQDFFDTYKQVAHAEDMPITKENIMCYVVEPIRIYTKLVTLNNQVNAKWTTLILDALECLYKHDEDQSQITPITTKYNLWCTYLTEKLNPDIHKLSIVKLMNQIISLFSDVCNLIEYDILEYERS